MLQMLGRALHSSGKQAPDRTSADVFVAAEIDRFMGLWRHADARVSAAWTTAIALVGATTAAVGIYVRDGSSLDTALHASTAAAAFLGVTLFVLGFRLIAAELTKAEYLLAINLLRGHAVTENPAIAKRLLIPPVMPPNRAGFVAVEEWFTEQLRHRVPGVSRSLLHGTVGACFGLVTATALWSLSVPPGRALVVPALAVTAGIASGVAAAILHHLTTRRFEISRVRYVHNRYISWLDVTYSREP
jgi:hypothetical protein